MVDHTKDSDCTVGPDGCCVTCGVGHTEECGTCRGRGFHRAGCLESDATTTMFYAKLYDAVKAARGGDLYVIDGPEDDFAVVDAETAAEIQDTDNPVNSYGFWSLDEARAFDLSRVQDTQDGAQ